VTNMVKLFEAILYVTALVLLLLILKKWELDRSWDFLFF
jgi:hypothetical protein